MTLGSWHFSWVLVPVLVALGGFMWLVTRLAKSRRAVLWLITIPFAAGLCMGILTAREPSGYVAAYGFGAAWVLSVGLIVTGLPMIALRTLRRAGIASLASGAVILFTFYLVIIPAKLLGLTAWR